MFKFISDEIAINVDVKKANLPKSNGPRFLEIKIPINKTKKPLKMLLIKLKIILLVVFGFILKFETIFYMDN